MSAEAANTASGGGVADAGGDSVAEQLAGELRELARRVIARAEEDAALVDGLLSALGSEPTLDESLRATA